MQLELSQGGLQQVASLLKQFARNYFSERFAGHTRYFDGKTVDHLGIPM